MSALYEPDRDSIGYKFGAMPMFKRSKVNELAKRHQAWLNRKRSFFRSFLTPNKRDFPDHSEFKNQVEQSLKNRFSTSNIDYDDSDAGVPDHEW